MVMLKNILQLGGSQTFLPHLRWKSLLDLRRASMRVTDSKTKNKKTEDEKQ